MEGDLIISSIDDTASIISAPQLQSVSGSLALNNVNASISFGALTVSGTVAIFQTYSIQNLFDAFPRLQTCSVLILNDTGLQKLNTTGYFEKTQTDFYIQVVSNTKLNDVTLANLPNCPLLDVRDNGDRLSVSLLNTTCAAIRLHDCASFSAPDLVNISDSAWTAGLELANGSFTSLSLPSISYMDGLTLLDNSNLHDLFLPSLEQIIHGALTIFGNSQLINLYMPNLTIVEGAVNMSGVFEIVNMLKLSAVLGAVNLNLRGLWDCSEPDLLQAREDFVKSTYTCEDNSTASHIPSGNDELSKGDKVAVGIGAPFVVFMLVALTWAGLTIRRHRKNEAAMPVKEEAVGKSELDGLDTAIKRAELDHSTIHELPFTRGVEIDGLAKAVELPAKQGISEIGEDDRYELAG